MFQEGQKEYQSIFWETLNIDYVDISYREFDQNLTLITKSIIDKGNINYVINQGVTVSSKNSRNLFYLYNLK